MKKMMLAVVMLLSFNFATTAQPVKLKMNHATEMNNTQQKKKKHHHKKHHKRHRHPMKTKGK
ncbi:MAG: hypothetical protein ABJA78_06075 [Ferruginibacter sp.]